MEGNMNTGMDRIKSLSFKLILIGLLAAVIVAGASCGEEEQTTTPAPTKTLPPGQTPTPTPSAPLTTEWSPDGTISAREYGNAETYGSYEIHWSSDEQYIYVGIKARTGGFVSVGFQPGSRMKNADIVFGFVKDGEVAIYDMFSTGNFGPHPPDTELGGTFDIVDFGGTEEGGFTSIEFKRALVTGDQYDNPLSSGLNKIIWSYGGSDSITLRHTSRGYGEIDI
jgi:hypothetical protein